MLAVIITPLGVGDRQFALSPSSVRFKESGGGGGLKKPLTSFENSRGCRPRCHGLSDLCCYWSGAVEVRSNMD